MKNTITILCCLLLGTLTTFAQSEGTMTRDEAETELAQRMVERVQGIVKKIDARLAHIQPIIKTMPPKEGEDQARTLVLWMQDGKAQKLEVSEPDTESSSIFYLADDELFFVQQPHSRFIFIGGELQFWTNESWEPNRVAKSLRLNRENLLYDEVNGYLSWMYERI